MTKLEVQFSEDPPTVLFASEGSVEIQIHNFAADSCLSKRYRQVIRMTSEGSYFALSQPAATQLKFAPTKLTYFKIVFPLSTEALSKKCSSLKSDIDDPNFSLIFIQFAFLIYSFYKFFNLKIASYFVFRNF